MDVQITNGNAEKTERFSRGKYGVMIHYVYVENTDWNRTVERFDCKALAEQLYNIGAAHLFFSVTQYNGYFCCPSSTYDRLVTENGYSSFCSRRDLIAELYDALSVYGIDLYLLISATGPRNSPVKDLFPWDPHKGVLPLFEERWCGILRELSMRYGTKVKGWWVNGCSATYPCFVEYDSPLIKKMAAAMRAGNPDALLAFNKRIGAHRCFEEEDYTAGEMNFLDEIPLSRFIDGIQWHAATYLGPHWGVGDCVRTNRELIRFIKKATDTGGVVTVDVAVENGTGQITRAHYEQMLTVRRFIRDTAVFYERNIPEDESLLKMKENDVPDTIPDGWINIAEGKRCYASSHYTFGSQNYPPEEALNANPNTGWAPADKENTATFWELDLGKETVIDGVEYVPRKLFPYERRNFECIASLDPHFTAYTTLLSHGEFPLAVGVNPAKVFHQPVLCRYIRFRPTRPGTRIFITQLKVFQRPSRKETE